MAGQSGAANMISGRSFDVAYMYGGGLKFVRWDYTAKNKSELSVCRGDEVEIIELQQSKNYWKVRHNRRTGFVPMKCFYARETVNWPYSQQYEGEISVQKGDVVGIIESNIGDAAMYKIMKEDGSEGLVPKFCFCRQYEVYLEFQATAPEEITVKAGDSVGLVSRDSVEGYWKVYLNEKNAIGLVPRKCFEPPAQVHWDHEGTKPGDLTVKKGDTVSRVIDGDAPTFWVQVRLGDKIGVIPRRCFEVPAQVYKDHHAVRNSELNVKRGDIVGIMDTAFEEVPERYMKVRFGKREGLVLKECFEIPAKVIKEYKAARSEELSVDVGQEVHVIDATAHIQVRLGTSRGEVPLECINIDVEKIVQMLRKRRDDDNEPGDEKHSSYEDNVQESQQQIKMSVDERALCTPLELSDSKTAIKYLKDLPIGTLINVGLDLGLSYNTLRAITPENIYNEMVIAWLSKKDNVLTTGIPTWKLLIASLQKVTGGGKIVKAINKDNMRLVLHKLKNLEWYDEKKEPHKISVVNEGCSKWHDVGVYLNIPTGILEGYRNHRNAADSFAEVLQYWLQTGGNSSYPATWIGLQKILVDCEMSVLADKIEEAMPYISEV